MAKRSDGNKAYKKIKSLEGGTFGKVFLVQGTDDQSLYVIKELDLNAMNEKQISNTLTEVHVLKTLNHPNVIYFKEVYKTKRGKLCIVMEYADNGDLSMTLEAQQGKFFPEDQILDWFVQICLALQYIHASKILHRDLKCKNLFLTKQDRIKVGDFGISCILSDSVDYAKTITGTPNNLSPEIINGKEYSFKSDIWSLGIVLYELCALTPPFHANGFAPLAMKILKGQYAPIPSHYSKDLQNLVSLLLKPDPTKRPTAKEILNLPFIRKRIIESEGIVQNQYFRQDETRFENHSQINCEQNLRKKNDEIQYITKIIVPQNRSGSFLRSKHLELSKRGSHENNYLAPNQNLLPSINHLSTINNNDVSSSSVTKNPSFLTEDDPYQVSKNEPRSSSEQKYSSDWMFLQEMQKNIKKNLEKFNENRFLGQSLFVEDEKSIIPSKTRHSLEPLPRNHNRQKNILKKIAEHDSSSLSERIPPLAFRASLEPKISYVKNSDQIRENNLDSFYEEESGTAKQNSIYSRERCQNNSELNIDDSILKIAESNIIKEESYASSFENVSSTKEGKSQTKSIFKRPQKKKEMPHEILKNNIKERNKLNKASSTELQIVVKSPGSLSHRPLNKIEPSTGPTSLNVDELHIKTKSQKLAAIGNRRERSHNPALKTQIIKSKGPDSLGNHERYELRSSQKIGRGLYQKQESIFATPIRGNLKLDRGNYLNESQISRKEDNFSMRDSLEAPKDDNSSYFFYQRRLKYIAQQKSSLEQINKGKIQIKGPILAFNKAMELGSTESLYQKDIFNKDMIYERDKSETSYRRRIKKLNEK